MHVLQHPLSPHRRTWKTIDIIGLGLVAMIIGHTLLVPVPWILPGNRWEFWQIQTVVVAGCTAILLATLARMPTQQPARVRWAAGAMIVGYLVEIALALLNVPFSDATFPLYLLLYLTSVSGIAIYLPVRALPRIHMFRLMADTLLVFTLSFTIIDVIIRGVLALHGIEHQQVFGLVEMELRLVSTIGFAYWYVQVYRTFHLVRGRLLTLWAIGLLAMVGADVMFTWGRVRMVLGASDLVYAFGIPLWRLHQVMWAWGLYYGAQIKVQWSTNAEQWSPPVPKSGWWVVIRQSLLLTVLVLISMNVVPSVFSLVCLIAALVLREALSWYDISQLVQARHGAHEKLQVAHKDLQVAHQQLEDYADQVEEFTALQERTRIARDLHDGRMSALNTLRMRLAACARQRQGMPDAMLQELTELQDVVAEAQTETRRAIQALYAPVAQAPLPEMIMPLIEQARAAGIATTFEVRASVWELSSRTTQGLYRVVQEAFTNIHRHAQATEVAVCLEYCDPTTVRLSIDDNGRGVVRPDGGFGVRIMRERIESLGGVFTIRTAPSQGFHIHVEVPAV
jgi:signal transduction histidine kinase